MVVNGNDKIILKHGDTYSIEYSYLGRQRSESGITYEVKDGTLHFDARDFHKSAICGSWCFARYGNTPLEVTIYTPSLKGLELQHFSACNLEDPVIRLDYMPPWLKVDDVIFATDNELYASQSEDGMTMSNCVSIPQATTTGNW